MQQYAYACRTLHIIVDKRILVITLETAKGEATRQQKAIVIAKKILRLKA